MDGLNLQLQDRRRPYALAVMAKAPLPGTAKTRLVPALGEVGAARLHRAFLLDTLALAQAALPADVYSVAPDEAQAGLLRLLVPEGITVLAQEATGLMSGLDYALRHLLGAGYRAVGLLDSDSPTLPPEHIAAAFAALESGVDVALGPCEDGGYYLLAAKQPLPSLFAAEYHSQTICQETARRAGELGLAVRMLPVWYDVDEPAELARLRLALAQGTGAAPRTARELAATGKGFAQQGPNAAV
ncbi:MAG: TIGR04282 family arsenosugar biosynthesis glycosyltransferase [Chloroflexota bacterium]